MRLCEKRVHIEAFRGVKTELLYGTCSRVKRQSDARIWRRNAYRYLSKTIVH